MKASNQSSPLDARRYEAPITEVIGYSMEGVLCESIRQIDNFEVLDELEW